ncbi:hypothetical protein Nepgr_033785 [Nepenthes gracilis]|uniref:Uncharacterized protein n=1 Tax=Nepenthes gracilis TaxID=150966 RepID=A0AAD3TMK7_NEPGR|nr:hypothetical protein Nepgr_033785 [Nepenthes gracilis]
MVVPLPRGGVDLPRLPCVITLWLPVGLGPGMVQILLSQGAWCCTDVIGGMNKEAATGFVLVGSLVAFHLVASMVIYKEFLPLADEGSYS